MTEAVSEMRAALSWLEALPECARDLGYPVGKDDYISRWPVAPDDPLVWHQVRERRTQPYQRRQMTLARAAAVSARYARLLMHVDGAARPTHSLVQGWKARGLSTFESRLLTRIAWPLVVKAQTVKHTQKGA